MYTKAQVTDRIYRLGSNDRRKALFENMWPLPYGVAYNCYLIVDDKQTALVDTVDASYPGSFIGHVKALLNGRSLDYLIINHMELDHSSHICDVIAHYPNVQIVATKQAHKMLEGYFKITENITTACDGHSIDLGHHKLNFIQTPWVHWPETMMTYDTTDKVLFSGDAFGSFGSLDGGIFDDEINFDFYEDEMRRYYSNIVGKYSNMVQKAFAKLGTTPVKYVCPTHGPVWRKNPEKVIGLYDKWSKYEAEEGVVVIYASMYSNTEQVADYIARRIAENGIKNIRVFDVSKTHISYLINEIWKYKGVMLGSCAYNSEMFPMMEQLCRELEHMGVKNRYLGLFGSFTWSGGGVKNLLKFAENIGWEQVADAVEVSGTPSEEKLAACDALAKAMAERVKE